MKQNSLPHGCMQHRVDEKLMYDPDSPNNAQDIQRIRDRDQSRAHKDDSDELIHVTKGVVVSVYLTLRTVRNRYSLQGSRWKRMTVLVFFRPARKNPRLKDAGRATREHDE